jgi:glycopeptide antibiotics resistance protein
MDNGASLSTPSRRTRWSVIVALAVLGAAIAVVAPVGSIVMILSMPLRSPTWFVWFGTVNGVALITVLALPVAALVVWALARRRSAAGVTSPWRMSLAEAGIVYGTVPWVWLIMLAGGQVKAVNLVPLRDLLTMSASQVVGNLLPFVALGFFAPLRFASLASLPRILALAAGCSLVVETAQYVLPMDRVSSVDDVLLNAAGAGLAALASRPWWRAPADDRSPVSVRGTHG